MQSLVIAQEIPANMQFDRDTLYTFREGPNAGRAVKYVGPGEEEEVIGRCRVITADGLPFDSPNARRYGIREGYCDPADLVVK